MFWNKAAALVGEQEEQTPEPGPVAVSVPDRYAPIDDDLEFKREWVELGKSIGIRCGKVSEYDLRLFLAEHGLSVYGTQKVFDYLTEKAGESNTAWKLYPLRQCDHDVYKRDDIWSDGIWPKDRKNSQVDRVYRSHRSQIPFPVMLTIKSLIDEFGDEVNFFVAAVADDPFLGVVLRNSNILFIERWDEPSFRG
jgi:hypothetical protein